MLLNPNLSKSSHLKNILIWKNQSNNFLEKKWTRKSTDHGYNQRICRVWEKMFLRETEAQQDTFNSLKNEIACQKA